MMTHQIQEMVGSEVQMLKTFKNIILILSLLFLSSCSAISVSHYKNQGVDFLNDGYYEDAIDSFDRALSLSDGAVGRMQFDILLYKAEGLFLIGEYEKANHIYDSLLKIDKNNKVYEELFNKSKAQRCNAFFPFISPITLVALALSSLPSLLLSTKQIGHLKCSAYL